MRWIITRLSVIERVGPRISWMIGPFLSKDTGVCPRWYKVTTLIIHSITLEKKGKVNISVRLMRGRYTPIQINSVEIQEASATCNTLLVLSASSTARTNTCMDSERNRREAKTKRYERAVISYSFSLSFSPARQCHDRSFHGRFSVPW